MAYQLSQADLPSMILVMGVTGSGKSYLINKLANRNAVEESDQLESCELAIPAAFIGQLAPIDLTRLQVLRSAKEYQSRLVRAESYLSIRRGSTIQIAVTRKSWRKYPRCLLHNTSWVLASRA